MKGLDIGDSHLQTECSHISACGKCLQKVYTRAEKSQQEMSLRTAARWERKEILVSREAPSQPLCTCGWYKLPYGRVLSAPCSPSCLPTGGFVWAHTDFPSLCLLHSNTWLCPQLSGCSFAESLCSWSCLWR